MSDEEDYEALRQKNIAERNAFLKDFLNEIKEDTEEINKLEKNRLSIIQKEKPQTPRSTRKRSRSSKSPTFQGPSRQILVHKKYNTRSTKKRKERDSDEYEDDDDDEEDWVNGKDIVVPKKRSNLKVMFSWSRPMQRDIDLMKFDSSMEESDSSENSEEEFSVPKKKRIQNNSRSSYDPSTIPSPDEITQKMLDKIAKKSGGKQYYGINATSCHQCRQKTTDTKTVCRSGECIGVRGQFCGPCLKGRYGESAYDALKDPHWACPPCRGLCNCSICRTRNRRRPTGILAPFVKKEGFLSVKDYLQAVDYKD